MLRWKPLVVISVISILLILGTAILIYRAYTDTLKTQKQAIGQELLAIARTTAGFLNAEDLQKISNAIHSNQKNIELSPAFRNTSNKIHKVVLAHKAMGFKADNVYVFVPDANQKNSLRWAVMLQDKKFIGEKYNATPKILKILSKKNNGGYTNIYLSEASNKRWLSAAAPISNKEGEVVGIVEIAWEIEQVINKTMQSARNQFLIYTGIGIMIIVIVFILSLFAQVLTRTIDGLNIEIAGRKKAEEKLFYDALHDHLTGLPNRLLFLDRIKHLMSWNVNNFFVLIIDLDNFKNIAETYGHNSSDNILKKMAHRIGQLLEIKDTIARPGGDEFWVLLKNVDSVEFAIRKVNDILEEIRQPLEHEGQLLVITASIGKVWGSNNFKSPESMIQNAEASLYAAKKKGRNTFVIGDPKIANKARQQLLLESQLRSAITDNEFVMHYQPIIDLENSKVAGFEALIRWNHPEKGLVFPDHFIEIAEQSGLINSIGDLVLKMATRKIRLLENEGIQDFYISVNLAAHQFQQKKFASTVCEYIAKQNIKPEHINLEITESCAMSDPDQTLEILEEIKSSGASIAIDDFGTGYSSLSWLEKFPVDIIKIDRSFLKEQLNHNNTAIIKSIFALAQSMKIKITVEGVESKQQLDFLRALGLNYIQGYYFSKAMPWQQSRDFFSGFNIAEFN